MPKIKNKSTIPQGMLAPNGYVSQTPNPFVQATTRPPGSLLKESPGYDTIRQGRNQFQGKGPTGGFRPMVFAEDVGGTGAALSVIPGDVEAIASTEWVEGSPGTTPEGTVLIADRSLDPGYASTLHESLLSLPDMGDREASRKLSKTAAQWLWHPAKSFENEYKRNPIVAVIAGIGAVAVITMVAHDVERAWRGRGGGVTGVAEAPVTASGNVVESGAKEIDEAANKAVESIEKVTNEAIDAIGSAAKDAADSVKGE